ncbi:MAG: VWA domain-containing protein [Acidobacteria bacterium]|nr:VWA domain-containing protein [Acidobacteriota bacterium]
MDFRFADPWLLLAAAAIPIVVYLKFRHERSRRASLRFSSLGMLGSSGTTVWSHLRHLPAALRVAALILLALAFARPQAGHTEDEMLTRGIDIMITLDNSTSMAAEDLRPRNRLAVAKEAVAAFIEGRKNDRMGLVVFAGRGYTACPLTLDTEVLLGLLSNVDLASRDEGTAIGIGLSLSLNRLRGSDAQSKVVVLLTDGRNNRGEIDPSTAAALAKTLGIRVYTIGVGTRGEAPYPVEDPILGKRYVYLRADLDDASLTSIAEATGGKYFRATDRDSLVEIFKSIDSLEKSDIKVRHYARWNELFPWLLWPAVGLVALELTLAGTKLRRLP